MGGMTRIKSAYRSEILRNSAVMIRNMQHEHALAWNLFDTGHMVGTLQMKHFTVADFETGGRLTMRVLKYMRFLDMNGVRKGTLRRDAYHLYNRLVYGYIYNNTLPQLKYGFTGDVQVLMRNKLYEMMGTPKGSNRGVFKVIKEAESGNRYAQAIISKRQRAGYR